MYRREALRAALYRTAHPVAPAYSYFAPPSGFLRAACARAYKSTDTEHHNKFGLYQTAYASSSNGYMQQLHMTRSAVRSKRKNRLRGHTYWLSDLSKALHARQCLNSVGSTDFKGRKPLSGQSHRPDASGKSHTEHLCGIVHQQCELQLAFHLCPRAQHSWQNFWITYKPDDTHFFGREQSLCSIISKKYVARGHASIACADCLCIA